VILYFFNLILLLLALQLFAQPAHAYLDPGTGSYVFQLLIAFSMGGLYLVKVFWKNIVSFFKKLFTTKDSKKNIKKATKIVKKDTGKNKKKK